MRTDQPCGFSSPRHLLKTAAYFASAPLVLCLLLAGCSTAPLNKHAVAFSASLAPVVSQSAEAYRDAAAVHNTLVDYETAEAYEKGASFDPGSVSVLLSEKDVQTRLAVLATLNAYSKSLLEITDGSDSPEMQKAAASVGNNLTALGNNLAPSLENVMGIAAAPPATTTETVTTVSASGSTTTSTTSSSSAPLLSPEVRNGISTAVDAFGRFLEYRTTRKELPGKIVAMDPQVQLFCKTLANDIHLLDDIEQRDYDVILRLENQFLVDDEKAGNVNPQARRAEIMRLPRIVRQQREAHESLEALLAAINNLALTHHALAAEAQSDNPESLKNKLSELSNEASTLGAFYSSLPTN